MEITARMSVTVTMAAPATTSRANANALQDMLETRYNTRLLEYMSFSQLNTYTLIIPQHPPYSHIHNVIKLTLM